jgi:CheY-like chemotaxis protein
MRPCIVVVEDEEAVVTVLQELLDLEGYRAVSVRHADLVLRTSQQHQPDLFLVDLMLPGASGIEVAEDLRSNGFAGTPMIAMSASGFMRRMAVSSGLFDVSLEKPFDLQDLIGHVRRLLDAKRSSASGQT